MNFDPKNIDVLDFLECLEIRNVHEATREEVLFSCPFPAHSGGDESPSAYMNLESTAFFCHSCHAKGNAIHFTAKMLDTSPLRAIAMLKARYQPGAINPDAVSMVELVKKHWAEVDKEIINPPLDDSFAEPFAMDWISVQEAIDAGDEVHPHFTYMILERGFTADTLGRWDFGWDDISKRITFPIFNEHFELVGFKGRAPDGERKPKYMVLGDTPGKKARYGYQRYHISHIVFGANRIKEGTSLIICEGELNAVSLDQKGWSNAVATNGSNFSQKQADIIRHLASDVTVFFDSDNSGYLGTLAVLEKLRKFMPVRVVPDHQGDPASMSEKDIEECLEGALGATEVLAGAGV